MQKSNGILTKAFISICAVNFVMNVSQFMMNTLLPKYAYSSFGATPTMVGVVTSVFALTSLVFKPVSGPAVDFFNKRSMQAGAIVAMIIAFIGYSVSINISMLIIFRLIHGLGMAISPIANLAMISDAVGEENLTRGVAYSGTVQSVATAIGPSISLMLQKWVGYNTSYIVGAGIMICALILTLSINIPYKRPKRAFKITFNNIVAKEAIIPASIMICLAANYTTVSSFLVLYSESIGVASIGIFFTVNAAAMVISKPATAKLAKYIGEHRVLPAAIICFAFSMVLISYSNSLPMFLLAALFLAFGYGSCQPLIQTLCMKSVSSDRRGSASATSYYGTDLGYLMGPIISGNIVEKFGYSSMFRTMPLLLLISLLLIIIFYKYIKNICFQTSVDVIRV